SGIVPEARVGVERKMGAIDGEIVIEQQAEQLVTLGSPRMRCAPEKAVMDKEQVGVCGDGQPHGGQARVHSRGEASDGAAVLDLEAVDGAFIIFYRGGAQEL